MNFSVCYFDINERFGEICYYEMIEGANGFDPIVFFIQRYQDYDWYV